MDTIINMETNRLSTQEFWVSDRGYNFNFQRHTGHAYDKLILKYIPDTKNGTCLEIGSYPGPHLTTFGDLHYTLNGVDFNPDNAKGLPAWLKKEGFKVGHFAAEDLFQFKTDELYDVVCSFGFIEHFINYEEVIQRHIDLTKINGYVLITTPNFRGRIQYWLHKTFDKENLSIHNVKSMRPDLWANQLEENGFEILYQGYFGGFWFWKGKPHLTWVKRKLIWIIERIIIRVRPLFRFESAAFSAHCGIVARKIR